MQNQRRQTSETSSGIPKGHLHFRPASYKFRVVLMTTHKFDGSLEQLTAVRKTLDIIIIFLRVSLVAQTVCLQCGRPRFNPWIRKIPWRTTHSSILAPNPMDRGAWRAVVHGVTKSQTRLSDFTQHRAQFCYSKKIQIRVNQRKTCTGQSLEGFQMQSFQHPQVYITLPAHIYDNTLRVHPAKEAHPSFHIHSFL